MLGAYQLDRAQRNLNGYAVLGVRAPLGVRTLSGACSSCRSTLRGLGASTPISAQDAMQQAMQGVANLNPKDLQNPTWLSKAYAQIQSGQFDIAWFSPVCAGQPAPNLNLFSTVSGLTLSAAGVGIGIGTATTAISTATSVALGAATMGAGLVISVIGMIFAHHHAAVKQEQQLGCTSLAAFNNAMSVIQQAVQNGQATPAAAAASLDSLYSNYKSYIAPSYGTSPFCNANCEMSIIAQAMVIYWKDQFSALAAGQAASLSSGLQVQPTPGAIAPATSTTAAPGSGSAGAGPVATPIVASGSILTIPSVSASAPASSSNWLMIAALLAGGFALARYA